MDKIYLEGLTVRVMSESGLLPEKQTEGSSGFDLSCIEDVLLPVGKTVLIKTGVRMEIPQGYEGQVRARSGIAKRGIIVTNGIGTIDADYRGDIGVLFTNLSNSDVFFEKGERIAQIVIMPVQRVNLVLVDDLSETVRGEGGFGSSGTK